MQYSDNDALCGVFLLFAIKGKCDVMKSEMVKNNWKSIDVIASNQQLGVEVREKYIQSWKRGTTHAILQGTPSITHHLSVVIVTSDEQENIKPLLEYLQKAFDGLCVEVILVDNCGLWVCSSADTTLEVIQDAARTIHSARFQIRLEHRPAEDVRIGGL